MNVSERPALQILLAPHDPCNRARRELPLLHSARPTGRVRSDTKRGISPPRHFTYPRLGGWQSIAYPPQNTLGSCRSSRACSTQSTRFTLAPYSTVVEAHTESKDSVHDCEGLPTAVPSGVGFVRACESELASRVSHTFEATLILSRVRLKQRLCI